MDTIKYLLIDFISIILLIVSGMVLQSYFERPVLDFVLLALICLLVGLLFRRGAIHGLTISIEFIVILMVVLSLISGPVSTSTVTILNKKVILSLLPLAPIGVIAGMLGQSLKKHLEKDNPREERNTLKK